MKIKEFLKTIDGLSPNTVRVYEQTLWQLMAYVKDGEPTEEQIKSFLSPYKASSLQRHKAAIKAYLEFLGTPWPFTSRVFRKSRRRVPRYLDTEQVEKIWAGADNIDDMMFVKTLFMLAARISELMGIEATEIGDRGVLVIGKGDIQRLIPCTPEFLEELRGYAEKSRTKKIFPKKYSYYYESLKELAADAGVKNISLHWLRHSRAVDLLDRGFDLAYVQQFMGHADISTTAIYLQVTGGKLVKEFKKLGNNSNGKE